MANEQYASFEERRRLDAESAGEAEIMRELERAAEVAAKVQSATRPQPKRGGK